MKVIHYVYIMAEEIGVDADGFPLVGAAFKIGVAASPGKRRKQLQTGNPRQLIEVHAQSYASREEAIAAEGMAHRILAEHRGDGEWFAIALEEAVAAVSGSTMAALH